MIDDRIVLNRFYFSEKQLELTHDGDYFMNDVMHNNYIQLENGELAQYTEWLSGEKSSSKWEDAVLVLETRDSYDSLLAKVVSIPLIIGGER